MKVIVRDDLYRITYTNRISKPADSNINYLTKLNGWRDFANHMIKYCSGKQPPTISTWLSRINSTLEPSIAELDINSMPTSPLAWQSFIKNWYATTLITSTLKANIETRVKGWNSHINPFLEYLQQRDYIPIDVIIPRMKRVGQKVKNSSFDVKIIGEPLPQKVTSSYDINKFICPINLSRTDAEYLDEYYYELELRRNNLYSCLVKYWLTIKSHFDYANKLIESTNFEVYERRIEAKNYKNVYLVKDKPPRKKHFLAERNQESFTYFLHAIKSRKLPFVIHDCSSTPALPSKHSITDNQEYYYSLLPKLQIEEKELFNLSDRLNWCLGLLTPRCISLLLALIIMENPKFNYEPLLFSKVTDKDGKLLFELSDIGQTYTIAKHRAKIHKKSTLPETSEAIIAHLVFINHYYNDAIPNTVKNNLFLARLDSKTLSIPNPKSLLSYLSGKGRHESSEYRCIYSLYPSLQNCGLGQSSISHKKLRDTEGVLEFFRTGSIQAVARKIGNSQRVTLEYYLPKPLIASFNTRQVRKFQNLKIVAATYQEDHMLEATDFNNIIELNIFIQNMLLMDKKNSNPLLRFIKNNDSEDYSGDLITNISQTSLTLIHAYRLLAEKNNIDVSSLKKMVPKTNISPFAIIQLSKYTEHILANHNNPEYVRVNRLALDSAEALTNKVNWGELLLKMEELK